MSFADKEGDRTFTDEKKVLNVVETLLNDQSYHIEFNGFLTNHVKHAVVALKGLGASPQRIKEYYDTYGKCTPYGYGLEPPRPSEHTITQDNWQVYFGKHCSLRIVVTPKRTNLNALPSTLIRGCQSTVKTRSGINTVQIQVDNGASIRGILNALFGPAEKYQRGHAGSLTPVPQRRENHDALHPCFESRWQRRLKSHRFAVSP